MSSSSLSLEAQRTTEELRRLRALGRAPLEERRAAWEAAAAAAPLPAGTRCEPLDLGVPALRVSVGAVEPEACVLLLHGGGYVSGNLVTHRELAARVSEATGASVVVVDYRRAPEHPFPAAPDDCRSAYRALLDRGQRPERLAVLGDSAGGALTAAVLIEARDRGWPLPAAGVMLSPWHDLAIESPSAATNRDADPSIVREHLLTCADQYLAGQDPRHPLASPLHADLHGLPPLYINVGDLEILLDDALIFAERARAAGTEVTLTVGRGLWHVYPQWASTVPEAAAEVRAVGEYLRRRLFPA